MSTNIEISLFSFPDLAAVEEIFFLTAAIEEFSSSASREAFKFKYLGYYLDNFPHLTLVAKKEGIVLGYCLGSDETSEAFYQYQPHLQLFSEFFEDFPAHLHINLHPKAQGLGIGQLLMGRWQALIKQNPLIRGLHIMTGPEARNRRFYQRLGFLTEHVRVFKGHSILFMGKRF